MATTADCRSQSAIYHSQTPRSWRLNRNGLNIEGLCTNIQCKAYNQMVVINLGIGEFDFARIILERKNKCPECSANVKPTKYALIRCQWRYVDHYSIREFPLNIVNDTYQLNDLHCEYKIIETMSLPKTDRICSTLQDITCSICLGDIDIYYDNDASHLRCSHTFHRTCIDLWLQSNKSMANKCPMCRVYIVERC